MQDGKTGSNGTENPTVGVEMVDANKQAPTTLNSMADVNQAAFDIRSREETEAWNNEVKRRMTGLSAPFTKLVNESKAAVRADEERKKAELESSDAYRPSPELQAAIDKDKANKDALPLLSNLAEYYGQTIKGARTKPWKKQTPSELAISNLDKEIQAQSPLAAQMEAKLQKIYKGVDKSDPRSVENAYLDAKEMIFENAGSGTRELWDDFANSNANYADYDPKGYNERVSKKLVDFGAEAGMDPKRTYEWVTGKALDNSGMDDERKQEALLVYNADNWMRESESAQAQKDPTFKEFALAKAEDYQRQAEAMTDQRFKIADQQIAALEQMIIEKAPPEGVTIQQLQEGLAQAKSARQGYLNPNAQIQAKYDLYRGKADAALPDGTPAEKLRKLVADLYFDKMQTTKRILDQEGQSGAAFVGNQMANSFLGKGHNRDHERLVELEAQIKDLAPIAFLNEHPAVAGDPKSGFFNNVGRGFANTVVGGKGMGLGGTSRQEDAVALSRNLQIAGIAPEALSDPEMTQNILAEKSKEPGLGDRAYWGNLLGTSGGLMFHIALATAGTKGLGMGKVIQGVTGGKGKILALLGDAIESGVNYEVAGRLSKDNAEELSFAGGFFGGAAASLGKGGFTAAEQGIKRMFGDKAGEAFNAIGQWGAKRAGAGVGESFEETGQQVVQLWNNSNTGQEFWRKMGEQFGDLSEATKFYVSTFVMGSMMGSAHSDGFGREMQNYAEQQIDAMTPADRDQAENLTAQLELENRAVVEGAANGNLTTTQETPEGTEEMVLTPEAQAAQAELEKSRQASELLGAAGQGREIADSVPEGSTLEQVMADRMDEEVKSLEKRLENPDLAPELRADLESQVEQKKAAKVGFEQMRDGKAMVPKPREQQSEGELPASAPQMEIATTSPDVEAVTTEEGETITPVEGSTTKARYNIEVGGTPIDFEIDTEGLDADLDEFYGNSPEIQDAFVSEPATDAEKISRLNSLADRLIAGEDRRTVLANEGQGVADAVDAIAKQRKKGKGSSEIPALPDAPAIQETRKPNPDRKTKAKPVAELTPAETVVESVATSMETPQDAQQGTETRESELDARLEQNVSQAVENVAPQGKKTKKQKPQDLPEGVEDQFTEATISGRRTAWQKRDGKWYFRNHKPGTKVMENSFSSDWQEAKGKDVEKAERMAAQDPLERDLVNSAKEWVKAWGDLVTFRNPNGGGKLFSSVDMNVTQNAIKVAGKTVSVGISLARVLAKNGKYTFDNWSKAMTDMFGDKVAPFLEQAWKSVSAIIPEGSTSPEIQANVDTREGNEKSLEVPKEKGKRGAYETMESYALTNPTALNAAIAAADTSYVRMNLSELSQDAREEISKRGGYLAAIKSLGKSAKIKDISDLPRLQAMRQLTIRFLGDMIDHLGTNLDEAQTEEEKTEIRNLMIDSVEDLESLTDAYAQLGTLGGQIGAVGMEWRMVMENEVGVIRANIERHNRRLMTQESRKGKERKRKVKETTQGLNEDRAEATQDIDAAQSVDNAITNVEEGKSKPKRKPTTKAKTGLGLTREQIAERKAAAKDKIGEWLQQQSGATQAVGTPKVSVADFAKAIGDYGVAVLAEGAITLREWTAKMKADLPQVTEQQLQEAWNTHEHDGKTMSEHSREQIENAAKPKPRSATAKKTLRGKIRQTINNHFKKDAVPMTLEQRLVDEVDLTPDEAAYIVETVQSELEARVAAQVERRAKALRRKPPRAKVQGTTDTQRAIEAMVDGEFTDEQVMDIFSDRIGLAPDMTIEQVKRMRELGKALQNAAPGSSIERRAAKALDDFAYTVIPRDHWLAETHDVWQGLMYANMLSGVTTHMRNLLSSASMIGSMFAQDLFNLSKWTRAVRAMNKAKGTDIGAFKAFMRASPLLEVSVKLNAMGRAWVKGAEVFWDIMKNGYIDTKYIEKGKTKLGRMQGILERRKFNGVLYPLNAAKYVGRMLAAEDAWNYTIAHEMEIADAVRRHNLGLDKDMSLRQYVNQQVAFRDNPGYKDALDSATGQVEEFSKTVPMTPKAKAKAIRIRTREILSDSISLEEQERIDADNIARSRIFTLKRNGIWGRMTGFMSKINTSDIGFLSRYFIPFTTIIGNIGDTNNDYIPFYGLIRSIGLSPTGIARNMFPDKQTAMLYEDGKTLGERTKSLFTGDKPQGYYEQVGRAWMGTFLLMAMMALVGDDDDDFIQITGSDNIDHPNSIRFNVLGNVFWVQHNLYPPIATSAAIVGNLSDRAKRKQGDPMGLATAVFDSYLAANVATGESSVAESAIKFLEVVSTMPKLIIEERDAAGRIIPLDKKVGTLMRELAGSAVSAATRPMPQNVALLQQIQQFFDPKVYSPKDLTDMLSKSVEGVLYRYDVPSMIAGKENSRYPERDIFGDVVERKPGTDIVSGDKNNDLLDFLNDHGGKSITPYRRNRALLQMVGDEEMQAEKMTQKQWDKYTDLAGHEFKRLLEKYKDSGKADGDYGKTTHTSTGLKITVFEDKVRDFASKANAHAKKKMKPLSEAEGGFGGKLVSGK